MAKQLQLSIPTPCHEDWNAMAPVEKGKFCGSCQKQVVDFSNMSDRQVAEFFKKPILSLSKGGSVCGRFMTDQLDRAIEIPKKRIPWVKYFFQFAIPAFLVSIKASAQKTQGTVSAKMATKDTAKRGGIFLDQRFISGGVARRVCIKPVTGDTVIMPEVVIITPVKAQELSQIPNTNLAKALEGKVAGPVVMVVNNPNDNSLKRDLSKPSGINKLFGTITGKVTDEKGNPLAGISLLIKGTSIGCISAGDGTFSIDPKAEWEKIAIESSGVGLQTTETIFNKRDTSKKVIVMNFQTFGMVYIVHKSKKQLKNVPLIPVISDKPDAAIFKVSPNPVSSGANLNIEVNKVKEGYYTIVLINQSGQSVYRKEIWIDTEAGLLSIEVPSVAAGNYFLEMTNKKSGERFTEKIILQ
jgi:CarboxypepD_reg-like domain